MTFEQTDFVTKTSPSKWCSFTSGGASLPVTGGLSSADLSRLVIDVFLLRRLYPGDGMRDITTLWPEVH